MASSSADHVLAVPGHRAAAQHQVAVQLHLACEEGGRRGGRADTGRPDDGSRAARRHHLRADHAPRRHTGVFSLSPFPKRIAP